MKNVILSARNVVKFHKNISFFSFLKRISPILGPVDFDLSAGEILGLTGRSGSGKSTLARILYGIDKPSSGHVLFRGQDLHGREISTTERLRVQMIFQDPTASLNPRRTIGDIIAEAPRFHGIWTRTEQLERVRDCLDMVGLPVRLVDNFAHELSGGQKQRVGIARALAVQPDVLICDEAVASLDVSVQAKILNLLTTLRDQRRLSIIFISHDTDVIDYFSDRVFKLTARVIR
ncbi:ABC transporter ATP-binding protein [Acetobacter persici]|uniref:ABC transporter ATP-binding protein n=1 Tax=Acetobacter persici TaxID=1076596 RepID=UPI001BAC6632|nr:dipeptide/oligopeptide/nickel ABC transporter ATP-binding protein [Acetobacter persici]MBS1017281.1 ABC transporter ATP-binding protein [Acetobacter persici]